MPQRRLDPYGSEQQGPVCSIRRAGPLLPVSEQLLDPPAIRGQSPAKQPADALIGADRPVEPQERPRIRERLGPQVAPSELALALGGLDGQLATQRAVAPSRS